MFKVGITTVRNIALESCSIIWKELSQIYVSPPNTHEWEKIADDFGNIWNLPNCVGAIDGKHINITCPWNTGSQYYNYKGNFSIVLLAACDANYTFTLADIGAYGSQSDGGILSYSSFGKALISGQFNLPKSRCLKDNNFDCPFYFVGDAAFPLKTYLLRPYPGRLLTPKREYFNMRLSRARRTIENAFGILTARWRILRNSMNVAPDTAENIVKACVVLHNFVKMNDSSYCPVNFVDRMQDNTLVEGLWRQEVTTLPSVRPSVARNAPRCAFRIREILADYLFSNKI